MLAEATAQLFLGVRLECAKCHHHPFEKYSQDDYYGLAAFFARTGTKNSEEFGLFGREQVVIVRDSGDVRHPRTNQVLAPKPLDGPRGRPSARPPHSAGRLADGQGQRATSPGASSIATWATCWAAAWSSRSMTCGRTNPPSNPPLLDALAKHFADSGFDLKQLMRTIMTSRLYQLDSQPTAANAADSKFYSHFHGEAAAGRAADRRDRPRDARCRRSIRNLPLGTRAIELPDAEYPDYFLNTFAKPRRVSVCECERMPDPSLAQALHTLNGDVLALKIRDAKSRVSQLLAAGKDRTTRSSSELYLAALCRDCPATPSGTPAASCWPRRRAPAEFYQDLLVGADELEAVFVCEVSS